MGDVQKLQMEPVLTDAAEKARGSSSYPDWVRAEVS